MASEISVGQLLSEDQPRDAIHVAIAAVLCASEELMPGQRIGFIEAGNTEKVSSAPLRVIGIVDPFLTRNVYLGQRFWMFLLPNTITSLRHDWTHVDFATFESERWLKQAATALEVSYDQLLDGARHTNRTGESDEIWHDTPSGAYGFSYSDFWKHYQLVTGEPVRDSEAVVFTGCC